MATVAQPLELDRTASKPARVSVSALAVAAAGLWSVVWLISLSRNLFYPLGFDQAFWQYATERVLAGQRMYVDVWDQNAPGVIAIHWLSTLLVGRSPMDLRIFDAGWQLLTMAALAGLVVGDRKSWPIAWLAAALYALAYYGTGYIHTAQRDGFTVLPMLLMLCVVARPADGYSRSWKMILAYLLAGDAGFAIFAIKPPLGLIYGAAWLFVLAEAIRSRQQGWRTWVPLLALSAGFIVSMGAGVGLLVRLGWWSAFVRTMTRSEVPGYILGPGLVRQILPSLVLVGGVILAGTLILAGRNRSTLSSLRFVDRLWSMVLHYAQPLRWAVMAMVVCAGLLAMTRWSALQPIAWKLVGLWLPACGAVLTACWRGRSRTWRLVLLTTLAVWTAIVLHGHFFLYHFHPLFAGLAYLSAIELADRVRRLREGWRDSGAGAQVAWAAVCLGGVAFMAVGFWGDRMSFYCDRPYVLAGMSLAENYDNITKHKPHYPLYSTSVRTAERVRALTAENEPIACLLNEPRIYYLSCRPPAVRMVIPNQVFAPLFEETIETIHRARPRVVLARIPASARGSDDLAGVQEAVFSDVEAFFGPCARILRDDYQLGEVIGDVCILQPIPGRD